MAQCIKEAEVVAYDDLGTEAIRRLEVENLPVIVVIDRNGNNMYETAVEAYLNNFVVNGYHSLELLQLQMESKQPLTNEILQNELGIDKLGYRARILNKLTEEGRILWNKLKTSILIVDKGTNNNGCECVIF